MKRKKYPMKEIEEKCPKCNEPVRQMRWDEHYKIVLCDNSSCSAYHEPVRVVQRLPAVPEEVIKSEMVKHGRKKGRKKGRKRRVAS